MTEKNYFLLKTEERLVSALIKRSENARAECKNFFIPTSLSDEVDSL